MRKILKKGLSLLLAITIIFSSAIVGLGEIDFDGLFAIKAEAASSGITGDCTWSLDGTTLTISGNGKMADYDYYTPAPWGKKITKVIISDGVTRIADYAFYGCTSLKSITIPDSVTNIGDYAFSNCSNLTSVYTTNIAAWCNIEFSYSSSNPLYYAKNLYINGELVTDLVIPEGVTSIGDYAFCGCTSLTSITIPDSVTSIDGRAFYGCTSLKSITIPDSVTNIGSDAFYNCTSLTSVYVTDIAAWCNIKFSGSSSNPLYYAENLYLNGELVTDLVIPEGVTSIGNYAFCGCTSLTSITIPDSVTSIDGRAFYGCTSLKSITIPDSVTNIGSDAFYNCTSLTSVYVTDIAAWCNIKFSGSSSNPLYYAENLYLNGELVTDLVIPEGVTSIGNYAFCGCTSLTSVVIPDSVTSIGYDAFYGCTSLKSITIPDSVTNIGSDAFYGCTSLKSVVIPDSVTSIGSDAFCDTGYYNNSNNWENDVLYIGNHLIKAKTSLKGDCTIKEGTKTIANKAFYNCTSLTSITIPDSVTNISDYAFSGCTSLTSVYTTNIAAWCNINFSGSYSYPLYYAKNLYINGELVTDLVIPEGVTSIGRYAFYGCTSLKSITIPDSVTSISDYAFSNCSNLTSVYVTDIAAWCNIKFSGSSSNPLYYAENLYLNGELVTDLVIPEGVTSIDGRAFYGCTSLKSITIPDSVTNIGSDAFYNCTSLTSVYVTDIAAWCNIKFSGSSSNPLYYAKNLYINGELVTDLLIPEDVTSIGSYAFCGCTSLKSITIPDSVTNIGSDAFYNCTSLTSVYVTDIAAWCNINFSSSSSNPLYYAKNLYINGELVTDLVIPEGVTSIGNCAFCGFTSLKSVIIPDSVTSIGYDAFGGCKSLKSITIPDSVTSIGSAAFFNTGYYNNSNNWENDVLYIGNHLIEAKTSLKGDYTIKNRTKTIADYAFGVTEWAFEYINVTSITIPDSVTSIGGSAFSRCTTLKSITIPDSVTSIGTNAFYGCTGLTSVVIPDSVTSIGTNAFYGCTSLTSVVIPDSVTSIGYDAFGDTGYYNNSNNWENDVLYIGNHLIKAKTSFKGDYAIKEGTKTIVGDAFYGCTSLNSITIPDSVTIIGSDAFFNTGYYNNSNNWENDVLYIGNHLIDAKTSLKGEYTIKQGTKIIANEAFYDCTYLESIIIPDSVTSIGSDAFFNTGYYNNSNNWENDVLYIGNHLIEAKTSLKGEYTIKQGTKIIANEAFYDCTSLKSIRISDSVRSIGNCAFYGCTSLKSITIPASVTIIDYSVFVNCDSLQYIFYNGSQKDWTNIDILSNNKPLTKALIHYNATEHNYEEIIDVEVTCTQNGVKHQECSVCEYRLEDEIIPALGHDFSTEWSMDVEVTCTENGVKSHHCLRCNAKKDVTVVEATGHNYSDWVITESATCTGDGSKFKTCLNCDDVLSETIPKISHSYNDWVIDIPATCTEDGSKHKECTICGDTQTVEIYSTGHNFYNGYCIDCGKEQLFEYKIENNSITITGYLGTDTEIVIPEKYIGLPVKAIATDAFRDNTVITSVYIPDSVTTIGGSVFRNCTNLAEVRLSTNMSNISGAMFFGCNKLESIVIPRNINRIDGYAFSNCSALKYVFYEKDKTSWDNITFYSNNEPLTDAKIHFNSSGEHSYSTSWIIDVVPSCTENGSKYRYCTVCGCKGDVTTIMATGHNFTWTFNTENATKTGTCYVCREVIVEAMTGIESTTFTINDAGTAYVVTDCLTNYSGEIFIPETFNNLPVRSIGTDAFRDCTNITSVVIPDSVTSIGGSAFRNCTNLTSIHFSANVSTIPGAMFFGCSNLESIVIPDTINRIDGYAFGNCTSLKNIVISDSVDNIQDTAFTNCKSLILHCIKNSMGHTYAINNGISYIVNTENTTIDFDTDFIRTDITGGSIADIMTNSDDITCTLEVTYAGTGAVVDIMKDGTFHSQYTLVVNGDTNGDSVCDVLDCFDVERASNGNSELSGVYAEAGDTNGDGIIDITDYQAIVNKAVL